MDVDSMVALVLGSNTKRKSAPAAKKASRGGRRSAPAAAAPEGDAPEQEAAPTQAAAPGAGHNTRTRQGREALDQAILAFLREQPEPVRALDIRGGVGGTAAQIRTRLNYLIEQGKVTYKGRASGTRYKAK